MGTNRSTTLRDGIHGAHDVLTYSQSFEVEEAGGYDLEHCLQFVYGGSVVHFDFSHFAWDVKTPEQAAKQKESLEEQVAAFTTLRDFVNEAYASFIADVREAHNVLRTALEADS